MPTLQNYIFSSCCFEAGYPRVGQNFGDVNNAELPHLEGIVTFDRHRRDQTTLVSIVGGRVYRPTKYFCGSLLSPTATPQKIWARESKLLLLYARIYPLHEHS